VALLVGVLLGVAGGYALIRWVSGRSGPVATPFLQQFALKDVAGKAGDANWDLRGDTIFSSWEVDHKRVLTRRVVAQGTVPVESQDDFFVRWQDAFRESLKQAGAGMPGGVSFSEAGSKVEDGKPVSSRLWLPRQYYTFGTVLGTADVWAVAHGDQVTLLVTLTEAS